MIIIKKYIEKKAKHFIEKKIYFLQSRLLLPVVFICFLASLLTSNSQCFSSDNLMKTDSSSNRVIASVDKKIITSKDLARRQEMLVLFGLEDISQSLVIENLIEEKIVATEADKYGIIVNREEVDETINQIAVNNGATFAEIKGRFNSNHALWKDFCSWIKGQLLIKKVLDFYIEDDVKITESIYREKRKFYEYFAKIIINNQNTVNFDKNSSVNISVVTLNREDASKLWIVINKIQEKNSTKQFPLNINSVLDNIDKSQKNLILNTKNGENMIGWVTISDLNKNYQDSLNKIFMAERWYSDPIPTESGENLQILFIWGKKGIDVVKNKLGDTERNKLFENIILKQISNNESDKWANIIKNKYYVREYS